MKKITLTIAAIFALVLTACSGSDGRDGIDGQDGVDAIGSVYQVTGDFNIGNNYTLTFEFPTAVEVFESDVVLVYILWEQVDGTDGQPINVWRLMPQTRLLDRGTLIYNYDHTFVDANFFLESDFDLSTLATGDTDNQTFRVAILPADAVNGKLDTSNINDVMGILDTKEEDVIQVSLK
ncbi:MULTISPECIES: collagen-like protein [unclassified Cellulophaga]|uniref:collagen-like protein n=1 Tax=unclassified Cellulophaga TaxID=2634405 RepID=UPI0026E27AB5|nr:MULTISPECIES: collagen-like protein [unclassified Cellulophaga]MDO6492090.1 collagen-like protein [Cellulophaga sp. 2_MG-2023]MDO6495749.1 collagen-like protein [Cellulophaga sp. 3_MG-2023]